nr:hypothetical protein [Tanacetum cinerariifolium]
MRQRLEEENESAKLKRYLEIVPEDDDNVIIKATPLPSKSPTIVDCTIYKEGKKSFFKITRADGNSQNYLTFVKMFKNFNREDLEVLWSIVKARFKKTNPIDDIDNLLFQSLKSMFEHHVKDNIWKYQQSLVKVLNWKLFDSCGVHCITTKNMVYYLLVEKMYPFTRNFLHQIWNDVRLQVDYEKVNIKFSGGLLVLIDFMMMLELLLIEIKGLQGVTAIQNGNKVLTKPVGSSEQTYEPTTAEEKQDIRNEMKARGTLLMALPNKDQLKFHSYQDAKLLMKAIEKRFGGNKESKKVQRTLLKQQYENFIASSSETLDQTFDRLQKLISQLELQGEVIQQEDINLKLLRSLPSKWKTHALIWRNKAELETISLDDLYNNLKIYKPEILRSSNPNKNPQNMVVSSKSTSSTNEADTTASEVGTAHTQEEMDLHWEMAMLTIRARRFMKRTGMSLDMNGRRIGFDNIKVKCFIYHKNGHFARECRALRNQDSRGIEYEKTTVLVETPIENALIAQDGIGGLTSDYKKLQHNLFSYKARLQSVEEILVHYKKNEVVFTEKINVLNLEVKLRDKVLAEYTQNLEKVEKERDKLKLTLEKLQNSSKSLDTLLNSQVSDKSKVGLGYKELILESFVNSSKLLEKQNNRSTKGYHKVPLPLTGNYMPLKYDMRLIDEHFESKSMDVSTVPASADKTVDITHKGVPSIEEPKSVMKNNFGPLIIEDWHSDDDGEDELSPTVEVKTVKPSVEKIEFVKTPRETVKNAKSHKEHKHYPRGNKRNWNNLMSHKLGRNFKMINKACYGNPQQKEYKEKGVIDSGCFRHMTGNKCYLTDFESFDGGFVSFGDEKGRISGKGNKCYLTDFESFDGGFVSFGDEKGRISGKGKIKTGKSDFNDVHFST